MEDKKKVSIELELYPEDIRQIAEKCASCGLTLKELIENFIGDLNDGESRNGSDEADRANAWFDRCWFAMFHNITFVPYILGHIGSPETFMEDLRYMEDLEEELKEAEQDHPEIPFIMYTPEELEGLKQDYEKAKEAVREYYERYASYKARKNEEPESLEDAIAAMKAYNSGLSEMLGE